MSHSNPFQPWKPHPPNLFNSTSGNFMQFHHHHAMPSPSSQNYSAAALQLGGTQIGLDQVSTSTPSISSSSSSSVAGATSTNFGSGSNSSTSSNKGAPNYHKINSIDKMVGLDNLVDEQLDNSSSTNGMTREERNNKWRQFAEKNISDAAKQQILHILEKIAQLSPTEKLLLYLRLPGGYPETDPLRQSQNPLGQRSEINHTINWVKSHLEHDDNVSIPKQDVYDDYTAYCTRVNIKPLSTADFGKVMKQVFPNIRPRRLGTRGNSRYCYAAMRKATKLECPMLPEIGSSNSVKKDEGGFDFQTHENSWRTVKSWAEGLLSEEFDSLETLAGHINKQHLNSPASISSRQLLQKKLLQKELKEKKKLNENSMKKRRKKRRKLSSQSENFDENSKNEPENSQGSKSPLIKREINEKSSDERPIKSPKKFVQPHASSTIVKRASNLIKQMDNEDEENDDCGGNEENQPLQQQQQQQQTQQGTTGLKKIRLTPRTDFGSISTTNATAPTTTSSLESGPNDEIQMPLSRERMISLCTINKDELGCYLPDLSATENDAEENSQDQEVELMQIFQAEGKTNSAQMGNNNFCNGNNVMNNNNVNHTNGKSHHSSIPVLENYQLQPNSSVSSSQMRHPVVSSQQKELNELRSVLQMMPNNNSTAQNVCSDMLSMMSQLHSKDTRSYSIYQRKLMGQNFPSNTHKNTFVPIQQGPVSNVMHRPHDTSPFVSPRATPIAKTKRNPNLAPLQMVQKNAGIVLGAHNTAFTRPNHFKQELPASAPSSPSLCGTFRYFSGQPANTASTIYHDQSSSRSQSVPLHQLQAQEDYSAYSSACNSVNPTPVPSEFHDFDEQQNTLLEMFSSESGVVPNIKMENDFAAEFLDTDEVSSTIDMQELLPDSSKMSLMSRSVPNTPLPCTYNSINNNHIGKEQQNLMNGMAKYAQSVPTTPVPVGNAFRYTPPATRDYLISGYNNHLGDAKMTEKVDQAPLSANSSFLGTTEQNSLDYRPSSVANDPIIESDIFNEMA
ncbi:uncharacterized protein LOC134836674 [Culicoides brevitarsis]|uniref:uncharacterized protein LOC134836674 n=1 Tax=Culicoides brevitarsis TaxID=469753 RepID=UPI00307C938B